MNKKIKLIIIVIIAAVLIIVGYAVYRIDRPIKPFSSNLPEAPAVNSQQTDKSQETKKTEPTILNWKLYKNSDFGFEIQYPVSWTVAEKIEENFRGEAVKEFFFKKPNSDLRFAILPRDALSYGLPGGGASENINIGGFLGVQTKYITADGRRLLLVHPQINMFNWDSEIGRLDIMSSALDPAGDFKIFNQMLGSFKFINL